MVTIVRTQDLDYKNNKQGFNQFSKIKSHDTTEKLLVILRLKIITDVSNVTSSNIFAKLL